ncbi:immunoglobulin domain-containing protein [Microbacterium rhizomatis]|uniref:Immunoglobulin domain-containing protein n=1 Tax=Microbacterium rhizomatis TaxID=1631477 RepID=A0A5J5J5K0_9MICO|nr:immunoglobulin domain-containing protein [Microbacterium rhizomatis]KAA9110188.1 immunoglobulin domain-containing protein [Microbacterium rhizomatis]
MPDVRFEYTVPTASGVDAPASAQLRLSLPVAVRGAGRVRTTEEFAVPLVAGVAVVSLSPGAWHVFADGVEGEPERWILVTDTSGEVAASALEDVDPRTLEPTVPTPSFTQAVSSVVAAYMLEHPSVTPDQVAASVAASVAAYLAENPPEDVTLIDHPTIPGAGILTIGAPAPVVAPVVTVQPVPASVSAGAAATFNAAATGSPTPSVQWQKSTNGGTTWNDVAGATSAVYVTPLLSVGDSGVLFRAVFTNAGGSVPTTAASVTVSSSGSGAPVITLHPASGSVLSGDEWTLTAAATGSPTPSVQWQVSTNGGTTWADIAGANSTSYTFTVRAAGTFTRYRAVFTNTVDSATTNAAIIAATD